MDIFISNTRKQTDTAMKKLKLIIRLNLSGHHVIMGEGVGGLFVLWGAIAGLVCCIKTVNILDAGIVLILPIQVVIKAIHLIDCSGL